MKIPDISHVPSSENMFPTDRIAIAKNNPNQFEHWWPAVVHSSTRAPKTEIIPLPDNIHALVAREDFDAFRADPDVQQLIMMIKARFEQPGTDALFIKNSLFSAKHSWERSCFLTPRSDIAAHLMNIQYQWLCASPDLATSLIIRELIPTSPAFHAFDGKIPITEEYRLFANKDGVYAYQPYWPEDAILEPDQPDWKVRLQRISTPHEQLLNEMASDANQVVAQLGGDWSIDFLIDEKGRPWLIDMALANQSYRSPEAVDVMLPSNSL